jgi:hypothetical protein
MWVTSPPKRAPDGTASADAVDPPWTLGYRHTDVTTSV